MGTHLDILVSSAKTEKGKVDRLVNINKNLVEELGILNKKMDSLVASGSGISNNNFLNRVKMKFMYNNPNVHCHTH